MQELNLILLERLMQLEAEQRVMAETIKEVQRRTGILDNPMPPRSASSEALASWSRRGLNLRLPEVGILP
jgi:hypothetical protein